MASLAASSSGSTSSSLLARLQARDEDAWQELVYIYQPLVLAWCRAYGLQAADAADVTQEVFRAVARALGDFVRERPGAFRGWLHTITLNAARQLWRDRQQEGAAAVGGSTQQGRLAQLPAASDESQSRQSEISERTVIFRRTLELVRGEFEARTFTAFWRTAVDGLSAPEVAAELSMTPAAVRQAKARVLRRLRDLLVDGNSPE